MMCDRWNVGGMLLLVILLAGCATPTTPTGGPPDRRGPDIVRTQPETGTTNFGGRTITLHFSEFVNRSTLGRAIVVEPDIGVGYNLDWGRKSVKIEFEEELPELTTVIVTIGSELQDMNGNNMANPQKIAVSTGPEIDEGRLTGRVINAVSGEAHESGRVLLYRTPVDLSERANYAASSDTGGTFQFAYLREGEYKAFWVDDRNRNKIWDREQERAQPFGREFIRLEKAGSDTIGTVYVTSVDTTRPRLQGVGLFSSQRMRLRFSEDISINDSTGLSIVDSTGSRLMNAVPLYISPVERYVLFAQSDETLDPNTTYEIEIEALYDINENPLDENEITFTGSAQEDTTVQRIIEISGSGGLFPAEPLEVVYAAPVTQPEVRDSLKIVEGDRLYEEWQNLETRRNRLQIYPDTEWEEGVDYEFRIWNPSREDYRRVSPVIWSGSQLGEIHIVFRDTARTGDYRMQASSRSGDIRREASFEQQTTLENLPPHDYTVRVFDDLNNNGKWDFGSVDPFEPPEPFFIQRSVPVRRAFTSDLVVTFESGNESMDNNE